MMRGFGVAARVVSRSCSATAGLSPAPHSGRCLFSSSSSRRESIRLWSQTQDQGVLGRPRHGRARPLTVPSSPQACEGSPRGARKFRTKRELASDGGPSFAFAFDIDGVLLHVATPIHGATETLRYLDDHGIPFILLTNGGGRLEEDRVRELSQKLDVPLTKANFIQSHTPFQGLVHGPQGLKDKNILVTGANAEKCRHIAEHYGFRNVITPGDILVAEPKVWPFDPLLESVYQSTARPLPAPIFHPARAALARSPSTALKIDAIFVFNDPRDWALDIQLITDLLLSEQGYLGTFSAKNGDSSLPNHGYQQDGQPSLYFSNADLFWATGFQMPRLGQGAFQAAVAGVWSSVTSGQELRRNVIGKPYSETYLYAEKVLHEHRHEMLMRQGDIERPSKLERVWMIGDNPASDVAGANLHSGANGTKWEALLVRTGVFNPERQSESSLRDQFAPRRVLDDVRGAVRWALEQEGWVTPQKLV